RCRLDGRQRVGWAVHASNLSGLLGEVSSATVGTVLHGCNGPPLQLLLVEIGQRRLEERQGIGSEHIQLGMEVPSSREPVVLVPVLQGGGQDAKVLHQQDGPTPLGLKPRNLSDREVPVKL